MDSITTLQLINTDTQKPIAGFDPLADGAILDLAKLPTKNLNINAFTNPAKVGSVEFDLDGTKHVENFPPYALGGDTQGAFLPWTPTLGEHILTVTPFVTANAQGTPGTPYTIHFNVVDTSQNPTPTPPPTIPAFVYNGTADIVYDGQGNFTITIKGKIQ